ncbi:hypothetical protein [Caldinitratiruptor microaerophilus]|uniref:Periplasmic heavy metal sensor n=1 Tax=Caldinitratiruptor microaerophilus TaxID=671077 RepID=A0AA35G8A6_9FIRM|nr:hypothetical protein [Caldinitratiruptor microaerophilus]BDG60228.1 hypothetical protein caldi_13180 [Caldinitratiruptor microaerophilus]
MARTGWKWVAAVGMLATVAVAGTALAASRDGSGSAGEPRSAPRWGWHGPAARHWKGGALLYPPRGWDGWQQALEQDPAKWVQRLENAVERIDRGIERLTGAVAEAEKELAGETDSAKKEFLQARLNVLKAQQTVLQRQREFMQVLLQQARSRAGGSGTSA